MANLRPALGSAAIAICNRKLAFLLCECSAVLIYLGPKRNSEIRALGLKAQSSQNQEMNGYKLPPG